MFELLHVVLVSGYQSWRDGGGVSGLLGAQGQSTHTDGAVEDSKLVHGGGGEGVDNLLGAQGCPTSHRWRCSRELSDENLQRTR